MVPRECLFLPSQNAVDSQDLMEHSSFLHMIAPDARDGTQPRLYREIHRQPWGRSPSTRVHSHDFIPSLSPLDKFIASVCLEQL